MHEWMCASFHLTVFRLQFRLCNREFEIIHLVGRGGGAADCPQLTHSSAPVSMTVWPQVKWISQCLSFSSVKWEGNNSSSLDGYKDKMSYYKFLGTVPSTELVLCKYELLLLSSWCRKFTKQNTMFHTRHLIFQTYFSLKFEINKKM